MSLAGNATANMRESHVSEKSTCMKPWNALPSSSERKTKSSRRPFATTWERSKPKSSSISTSLLVDSLPESHMMSLRFWKCKIPLPVQTRHFRWLDETRRRHERGSYQENTVRSKRQQETRWESTNQTPSSSLESLPHYLRLPRGFMIHMSLNIAHFKGTHIILRRPILFLLAFLSLFLGDKKSCVQRSEMPALHECCFACLTIVLL